MKKQDKIWLAEIRDALNSHYDRKCLIEKEMKRAEALLSDGKEYYFSAGLFGAGFSNREERIFLRGGYYNLYSGWSTSSDKSFR